MPGSFLGVVAHEQSHCMHLLLVPAKTQSVKHTAGRRLLCHLPLQPTGCARAFRSPLSLGLGWFRPPVPVSCCACTTQVPLPMPVFGCPRVLVGLGLPTPCIAFAALAFRQCRCTFVLRRWPVRRLNYPSRCRLTSTQYQYQYRI